MNFIDNLEIKNFKSIRHQKIEGCKKINVFIGYPNVGKSNILEALSIYSINLNNNNLSDFVRFDDVSALFHNGKVQDDFEIKINKNHRAIGFYLDNSLVIKRQYSQDDLLFNSTTLANRHNDNSIVNAWTMQVDNNNSVSRFDTTNGYLQLGRHVLGEVRKYVFKKIISPLKEGYSFLNFPFGENIFSILSSHSLIRKQVVDLFKPFDLLLNFDRGKNTLSIAKDFKDGSIFTLSYSMIADTLQRLIFHKAAIATNENNVLIFEEPEANMFPPYIKKINNRYFI